MMSLYDVIFHIGVCFEDDALIVAEKVMPCLLQQLNFISFDQSNSLLSLIGIYYCYNLFRMPSSNGLSLEIKI